MKKEVQKHPDKFNLNLLVYNQLKAGIRPSNICKKFKIKPSALQYYLSSLKQLGFIKKVGYGTWEIVKKFNKRSSNKHLTDSYQHPDILKPDQVRAHAFLFTIKIPKLKNWHDRERILSKHNINYKPLKSVYGGAQLLLFKGRKVILTNKSILIYEKNSYIADTGAEAKSQAIYTLFKIIRSLEKTLKTDFSFQGQYKFKVSRQHYALVKNALARQYDKEGKKLNIYSAGELWFIIDNSFNLHEAETIHPDTALTDNQKVQNFFNGIKLYDNYTPNFVLKAMQGIQSNQHIFAQNINTHIKAIQDLGAGVSELTKLIVKLKK